LRLLQALVAHRSNAHLIPLYKEPARTKIFVPATSKTIMNTFYIKTSSRGTAAEIESVVNMLPRYTKDLNEINHVLIFVRRLKEITFSENNDSITHGLLEIEKQGILNHFLIICLLDFLVVYKNSLSAIHLWDELHSLRQGYLLIHEALKTYNGHNKSLKELASKTSPEAESLFYSLSGEIKRFKEDFKYHSLIADLRNNTIAHIEKDTVNFFDKMSKFDTDVAFAALKAFPLILGRMLKLSDLIFKAYTKTIIKQISFDDLIRGENSVQVEKLLDLIEPDWRKQ